MFYLNGFCNNLPVYFSNVTLHILLLNWWICTNVSTLINNAKCYNRGLTLNASCYCLLCIWLAASMVELTHNLNRLLINIVTLSAPKSDSIFLSWRICALTNLVSFLNCYVWMIWCSAQFLWNNYTPIIAHYYTLLMSLLHMNLLPHVSYQQAHSFLLRMILMLALLLLRIISPLVIATSRLML